VFSSPAVANGVVYVGGADHNVYALDASTGAKLWSFPTGGFIDHCSPAVANGVVYIGSGDGKVDALDATSRTKLWTFTTGGGGTASPAVANGTVYVGSNDGKVYAFDLAGGAGTTARPAISKLHPNYALHAQRTSRTNKS